jgi:hypothetical protein
MRIFITSRLFLLGSIIFTLQACSPSWSEVIQYGNTSEENFSESIPFTEETGLIILPVTIRGKNYRFILDSGAPTSISHEIQKELSFKKLFNKHIRDSEGHRKKVAYVNIDALELGDISFEKQTAFVGDFTSNPVIECLKIDGIIGSNTMRICNWIINSSERELSFFNSEIDTTGKNYFSSPFQIDHQYDILVDLRIGRSKVKNIKVDYGSNGSLSLPESAFSKLKEANILSNTHSVTGQSQTGFLGEVRALDYEISYADSIYLGNCLFEDVKIKSKGKGLLGNQLLGDYVVSIDWRNQQLYFEKNPDIIRSSATFGFSLGLNRSENYVYVQSVIEESTAYKKGIRPLMKVSQIDSIAFDNEDSYCNYVNWMNYNPDSILLVVDDNKRFTIYKEILNSK